VIFVAGRVYELATKHRLNASIRRVYGIMLVYVPLKDMDRLLRRLWRFVWPEYWM
jgi:hypothetical protein